MVKTLVNIGTTGSVAPGKPKHFGWWLFKAKCKSYLIRPNSSIHSSLMIEVCVNICPSWYCCSKCGIYQMKYRQLMYWLINRKLAIVLCKKFDWTLLSLVLPSNSIILLLWCMQTESYNRMFSININDQMDKIMLMLHLKWAFVKPKQDNQ